MADFVRPYWGSAAATIIALSAALSAFGALNGWILVQGEMPWAMAREGTFPAWLAKRSRRDTPVRAHLLSSLLMTIVLFFNASKGLADLFSFVLVVATLGSLIPYLVCTLAAVKLGATGRLRDYWIIPFAMIAAAYSLWAIWGSGWSPLLWCFGLQAAGLPIYFLSRPQSSPSRGGVSAKR